MVSLPYLFDAENQLSRSVMDILKWYYHCYLGHQYYAEPLGPFTATLKFSSHQNAD